MLDRRRFLSNVGLGIGVAGLPLIPKAVSKPPPGIDASLVAFYSPVFAARVAVKAANAVQDFDFARRLWPTWNCRAWRAHHQSINAFLTEIAHECASCAWGCIFLCDTALLYTHTTWFRDEWIFYGYLDNYQQRVS